MSVTVWPTTGAAMFEASVHAGTAVTGPVHWTTTLAGLPVPAPFDATSEYSFWPAAVTVSVQLGPLDVQPVHVKVVGLFVHDAEIVSVDPVCGVRLLARERARRHGRAPSAS